MRIDIYGLGYVGSVSAACLADGGHDVCGIDIDPNKVVCINAGKSPVREPGLPEHIAAAVESGRLRASSAPSGDADVSMVCVGTPSNENGSLRLDYLQRTMEDIGDALARRDSYHVVCIRSTVLPGTTECVAVPILEQHSGKKVGRDFGICMNPEFLREGSSIQDYRCPPFTIIGELDARSGETLAALYDNIPAALFRTKLRVAEMVKYAANVYHALKITFANELGVLCKRLGLDSREVFRIFCEDKKLNISPAYLQPGFAFGGSCLPKDLRAILYKAKELDVEPPLLRSILASNTRHIEEAYRLIKNTGKRRIAILGLSFKVGTDDLRESPIAELVEMLVGKGYWLAVYDRDVSLARLHGSNRAYIEQTIPHLSRLLFESIDDAIAEADVVVVAKRSPEAEERLSTLGPDKVLIDLAPSKSPNAVTNGAVYEGICW
jgi:GDP-mannose 6-dehydrogenase